MKIDFDIKIIRNSNDQIVKKNELIKLLKFYFVNGRPKSFSKYIDDINIVIPSMMKNMSFDELLFIVPNLYQFFYTVTINEFFEENDQL